MQKRFIKIIIDKKPAETSADKCNIYRRLSDGDYAMAKILPVKSSSGVGTAFPHAREKRTPEITESTRLRTGPAFEAP